MPKVMGKPINIFSKAERNEGQCLSDDDGSSNDFDDIPSQHTHFLRHICQKVSFAHSSDCPAWTADYVNCAGTEHQVHLAWNVTGSPTQMLFCLL